MAKVTIIGNTFPVKEQLKTLGAHWNSTARGWDVDESVAEQARQIVASGGQTGSVVVSPTVGSCRPTTDRRRLAFSKCQVCGEPAGRYKKIYASGECRDCYEERKMGY